MEPVSGRRTARNTLEEGDFALVLTEARFGRLDTGYLREMAEICRGRSIPLVVVTASCLREELEAIEDAGAEGLLCKPYLIEDLMGMVAGVLQDRTPSPLERQEVVRPDRNLYPSIVGSRLDERRKAPRLWAVPPNRKQA